LSRPRKTEDEYRVFGDYGQGWEELTAEETAAGARRRVAEYNAESPGHRHKWTGPHRVKIEAAA
jgi:hypothetical protein